MWKIWQKKTHMLSVWVSSDQVNKQPKLHIPVWLCVLMKSLVSQSTSSFFISHVYITTICKGSCQYLTSCADFDKTDTFQHSTHKTWCKIRATLMVCVHMCMCLYSDNPVVLVFFPYSAMPSAFFCCFFSLFHLWFFCRSCFYFHQSHL